MAGDMSDLRFTIEMEAFASLRLGCLISVWLVNEGFCPHGAKNITVTRLKESKMEAIRGKRRRSRFGTSVALATVMVKSFNTNWICFAEFGEADTALTAPVILISS